MLALLPALLVLVGTRWEPGRRQFERVNAAEQSEIAAREATETARIVQEERVRALEIARNKAVDEADIAAREAVEAARIALPSDFSRSVSVNTRSRNRSP